MKSAMVKSIRKINVDKIKEIACLKIDILMLVMNIQKTMASCKKVETIIYQSIALAELKGIKKKARKIESNMDTLTA